MGIDLTNKDNLEQFVKDNIAEINEKITQFTREKTTFNQTDIKRYLRKRYNKEFASNKEQVFKEWKKKGTKKAIPEIANIHTLYKKDVEAGIEKSIFQKMNENQLIKKKSLKNEKETLSEKIADVIMESASLDKIEKDYIKNSLLSIVNKTLRIALNNGFCVNRNNLDEGLMTANAGDSAQFLFLARAILAGYNCSNVDVRSSSYDAVIDYNGKLFRVQVKGISYDKISFKNRDRGGEGIDSKNERNRGTRITATDCDIFVAVDKSVGLCYVIPMRDIDPWKDSEIINVPVNKLEEYLENWGVIDNLYNSIYSVST